MKGVNKFTMIASKIIEVFLWVGTVCLIIGIIGSCFVVTKLNSAIKSGEFTFALAHDEFQKAGIDISAEELAKYAQESEWFNADGTIKVSRIILTLIGALAECAAFALVFRNIYLIIKTSEGKTVFSHGATPFQEDITRMIREIGIFLFVMSGIVLALSWFGSAIEFNLLYVFIGLLMLSLSNMFRYGEELQQESDETI